MNNEDGIVSQRADDGIVIVINHPISITKLIASDNTFEAIKIEYKDNSNNTCVLSIILYGTIINNNQINNIRIN